MEVRGPEGWDFWPEIGKGGESGVTEDLGEFHSNWGRIHDSGHDAGVREIYHEWSSLGILAM